MKAIETTRTEVVTKYRAFDGTDWDTPDEALSHEQKYCDDLYDKMHGASYPKNEIKHLPFPADEMIGIYKDFSHEIFDTLLPGTSDPDWSKISFSAIAQISYEMDMSLLLVDHSAEELFNLMVPILEKHGLHKIYFYVIADIPRGIKAAKIRNDWAAALRNTKDIHDITWALQWSFTNKDIITLAQLHKSNKFRRKIEDILTDANFHQEAGDFMNRKYDDYLAKEE